MRLCRGRNRGFSLTELLVVIGIIILLVSIGLPTYFSVRRNADISRTKLDLRSIEMGLEEYRKVFNALPMRGVNPSDDRNERVLYKYLISRDPAAGYGIKAVGGGRVWGPFLSPEKFKPLKFGNEYGITDRFGSEIQYYPKRKPNAVLTSSGSLVGNHIGTPPAMFEQRDGPDYGAAINTARDLQFRWMLGAKSTGPNPDVDTNNSTRNNLAVASDLTFNGDFVLISAGADRKWGLVDGNTNRRKCDDVYNFERP